MSSENMSSEKGYTVYVGTGENFPDAELARRLLARYGTPAEAVGYWDGATEKTYILNADPVTLSAVVATAFGPMRQDAVLIEHNQRAWVVFKNGNFEPVGTKKTYRVEPDFPAWTYHNGEYIVFN